MSKATERNPAGDLYAVITHVHANAHGDFLDTIDRLRLTGNQVRLLHRLQDGRQPTIKQVAHLLDVSEPSASELVADLDRRRLVDRIADERDARAKHVVLTPDGRRAVNELAAVRHDSCQRFLEDLSDDERDALGDSLELVCKREEIAARRPANG